ncbi:coiled-coil domain-containing protein 152 isoform X2 [Nothobranchius furzeri]|uniref:coiled-coil domain-containing protein 152 isoform X2 n=1 Tax=Nothobranchius furzeri TaxID=105023 RepID=UPI002403DC88|nr:coiled-coil domain-containing protein 152-like isoform X2 [Nothobranchius furzeri]
MTKSNCVNLDRFMEEFGHLEQKIMEFHGKNSVLEVILEDAKKLDKFHQTKEKSLIEVENERLQNDILNLKQQNERAEEVKEKQVQQLVSRMRAEEEHHQRALEAVRQQCHREALHQLETKDAEVKKLLEEKDLDLEEMRRKLKDQERERQSELLKLQMELGAKLARAQSSAQRSHQQQLHGPNLLPQSVFKRKLQYFQEEKNKEISALRQRIRELEASQRASSLSDSKRRKM